jgi:hypothetical protein
MHEPGLGSIQIDSLHSEFRFAFAEPSKGLLQSSGIQVHQSDENELSLPFVSFFVMRAGYARGTLGAPGTLLR